MLICLVYLRIFFYSSYRKNLRPMVSRMKKSTVPFIEYSQSKYKIGEFFSFEGFITCCTWLFIQYTITCPSNIVKHNTLISSLYVRDSMEHLMCKSTLVVSLSIMQMYSQLLIMKVFHLQQQNIWLPCLHSFHKDCRTVDSSTSLAPRRLRLLNSYIIMIFFRGLIHNFATNKDSHLRLKQLATRYRQLLRSDDMQNSIQELQDLQDEIQSIEDRIDKSTQQLRHKQQLKIVRQYVNKNVPQQKQVQGQRYVPGNITLHKLYKQDHKLLMVGVDKMNLQHSLFVGDLIKRLSIKVCATQIPPDSYFFIKTEDSLQRAWNLFLKGQQYTFFVNPVPRLLQQMTLDQNKIPIVKHNIFRDRKFQANVAYGSQYDPLSKTFMPNSFLTPFFCNQLKQIVFCDYPILKQRQYQANLMSLKNMRTLFQGYMDRLHAGTLGHFDPRLMYYPQMLKPKIAHMTNVLQLMCLTQPTSLAIVDRQYTQFIAEQWPKLKKPQSMFNFDIQQNQCLFVEYIQKLVMLDLMLSPLINTFFIRNNSFPFDVRTKVGGKQLMGSLFVVWNFYYGRYSKVKFPQLKSTENLDQPDTLNRDDISNYK